jgi:rhomboid protease GluP
MIFIVFIIDTFVLVGHSTGIFSMDHLVYGDQCGVLTKLGRISCVYVLKGQWWRVITPVFLHSGLLHLAANMLALLIVGYIVEEKIGAAKYILAFAGSAVFSSLCIMKYTGGTVGASGGIFGIIGVMIVIFVKDRSYILEKMSIAKWIVLVMYVIISNLIGRISVLSHASGLAAGIIIGILICYFSNISSIASIEDENAIDR